MSQDNLASCAYCTDPAVGIDDEGEASCGANTCGAIPKKEGSQSNDLRPRCPKCGEPARIIILTNARARCELNENGLPGKVLSASHASLGTASYECGGGHVWDEMDYDPGEPDDDRVMSHADDREDFCRGT